MEPLPGARGRGTRLALVALAVFVLLAIVGFASRSGFGGSSDARPSPTYVSYAFSIFLVLFVLAIPMTVYAFFMQGRETAVARRRSFTQLVIQNVLTFGFFVFVVFLILYMRRTHPNFLHFPRGDSAGGAAKTHPGHDAGYEPVFKWPVLAVAIPLLLALVAWAVLANRRRKARRVAKRTLEQQDVAADVAASIGDAIDDLEAEPDARRAVIAAYARMEGVLSRHGIPRRPSETAFEYLGRVLLELRAPADAVRRLTRAFERAKFSPHEIDTRLKRSAIDALLAIRDGLQTI
jgi:hypothetical protein